MERAKRRKRFPLWLRIVLGLLAIIALLLTTTVALRFWITSDSGRAFILSQIDGRKVGPFGTLRLSGLKGDPLQSATLADIALVDDEGIWLRAKDARVEWTPTDLFSGDLVIKSITVRTVDVVRKPLLALQDEETPPLDIGLRLDAVAVEDLHLATPVIGIEARYRIDGGAARPRDGSGFARLTLSPVSGPDDKADLSAEWTAEGGIKGAAELSGPPGGLMAAILQSPADQTVSFSGDVAGTLQTFTTKGTLKFGSDDVVTFRIARTGDKGVADAVLLPEHWPVLAAVAERTGARIDLHGEANLKDVANAPTTIRIAASSGLLEAATVYDFTKAELPAEVDVSATGIDLGAIASPLTGKVDTIGKLSIGLGGVAWKGNAIGTRLTWPSGRADRMSAPVAVNVLGNVVSFEIIGANLEGVRVEELTSLAPARYKASVRGEVNVRTGIVEIQGSQIEGTAGSIAARGAYETRTGTFELAGSTRINRLADITPLTGTAQGRWATRRSGLNAPIRVTADLEGRAVGSSNPSLAELIGRTPRVTIAGAVSEGRFAVESGTITGQAIRANMTGRIADSGAITGRAAGTLHRRLDLGGVRIESAAFDADVTGTVKQPQVKLRLRDGEISAAGITIANIGGTAEARLGESIAGRFTLTGTSQLGEFKAAGDINAGEGDLRIEHLNANLGDLKFFAPRLGMLNGVASLTFSATGPLDGLAGIEKGTLSTNGSVRLGEDLIADISGRISDVRMAGARFDLVAFDSKASGGKATVGARAVGVIGAPVDLKLTASGTRQGEVWSGDVSFSGTVDELPIRTSRPALWKQGPSGWSLDAALNALRGTIDIDLAEERKVASAKIEMSGVSLGGLSRLARLTPIAGTVTGSASFSNAEGPATGDLRLDVANANPVGVTADPVALKISASLRNGIVTSESIGEGQGFSLTAKSRFAVVEEEGFSIFPDGDGAIASQVDLHGRAEQLWALFGPEDQSLRGKLDADLHARGTLSDPIIEGAVTVSDGAYEHGDTGLALRGISGRGVFNQNSAQIEDVKANDGRGGTLTGAGEITWNGNVHGGITFKASNLRALGRDDRFAIVSGDGAMEIGDTNIKITGKFAVQQARISIEQPASASIPTIRGIRRVNFPNQSEEQVVEASLMPWQRPVQLDLQMTAPRRVVVFGRGLDTEWGANVRITGPIADPSIAGTATLVRGDVDLAGRRFAFDTGTITLDGPIRLARIDIAANRSASDITASVRISGTPVEPKFVLESTPALPQDEILSRVLFGRSVTQLSGFETAQLAAGLAQLAGGQAGFDPVGLVRKATGLDRVTFGAENGIASVSAGKYIAEDVYVQVGAGATGGVGAAVEWEPTDGLSITSSASETGDTKLSVRWKKDY